MRFSPSIYNGGHFMKTKLIDLEIKENNSNNITEDIAQIVEQSRKIVYSAVDIVLLQRNWQIGKRIHEEIMNNDKKDNYGKNLV